ncbi:MULTISPECIES: DUF6124 family protein [unclassified Pseudomonas]|jgi:hypothetical protein|uniref:DUF6124 family protein n=1 Tax=unclassified Pseudomonas TaxID=196821 RepID=UPI000F5799F7|nr:MULTISPECIES: DUF6124 family protein [unclassified Pseudomonas]AZF08847.1 hypothetical protein C4J93_0621 [Pseudomonas sp. R2-37-08W]AZF14168.1 hypothetical protein C4J92_0656 [Pseudomonas sp. R3-18-08]
MIKDSPNPPSDSNLLFILRPDLDNETLLVNASQDLESINAIATHLAFEVDGPQRSVVLGLCRMVEGVQLLIDRMVDGCGEARAQ